LNYLQNDIIVLLLIKTRQLQRSYSQQQPRYRRRSIRSKFRQRNLRHITNIISK